VVVVVVVVVEEDGGGVCDGEGSTEEDFERYDQSRGKFAFSPEKEPTWK
jgi:hypothetical protein